MIIGDDDYPDSGPLCEHYADPDECDAVCRCGHRCDHHKFSGVSGNGKCGDCSCLAFEGRA